MNKLDFIDIIETALAERMAQLNGLINELSLYGADPAVACLMEEHRLKAKAMECAFYCVRVQSFQDVLPHVLEFSVS